LNIFCGLKSQRENQFYFLYNKFRQDESLNQIPVSGSIVADVRGGIVMELSSPVELKDDQLDAVAAGALVHLNNQRLMNNLQIKKSTVDVIGDVTGTVTGTVG
jgi:hypothetical protein